MRPGPKKLRWFGLGGIKMKRKTIKEEIIAVVNSTILAVAFVASGAVFITVALVGLTMLKTSF